MFDIGWTELLLIGVVALIVVGPRDLPGMFRTLGRFTAKIKSMGREFTRAMDQAAKESGVGDVAKDLRKVTSPTSMGLDRLKDAADRFEKWEPGQTQRAMSSSEASRMSDERAEKVRKIQDNMEKVGRENRSGEAPAAAAPDDAGQVAEQAVAPVAPVEPPDKAAADAVPPADEPPADKPAAKGEA